MPKIAKSLNKSLIKSVNTFVTKLADEVLTEIGQAKGDDDVVGPLIRSMSR